MGNKKIRKKIITTKIKQRNYPNRVWVSIAVQLRQKQRTSVMRVA